jgi:two-component system, NarL family, nitrate/nitrite response regulator NarL
VTVTVLLADDHVPTRAGLRGILEDAGMAVVADVGTAAEALAAAIEHHPDVCVLDVQMPGGGIAAAGQIAEQLPGVAIVMLAAEATDEDLMLALRVGARGYLLKDADAERLPETLRGLLAGEAALPRRLVMRVVDELHARERRRRIPVLQPGAPQLTEREWEVLELLSKELPTREVAQRLEISEVTVRRHLSAVMAKLGVGSRAAAIELVNRRDR